MAKYVLVYKGGKMAETEAEQAKSMDAWMGWFATLGAAVVDGGNPFAVSTAINADGSRSAATAPASGYSILDADSLDGAADLAKGCPVLEAGGSVEVYEALPM